jgi:drug/metabolite transporter (DMT)-like permease
MNSNSRKTRAAASLGASLVVLSSFFYASYGIWTKLMGNFFGGYTASAWRSVLVVLMIAVVAVVARQFEAPRWRQTWPVWAGMLVASSLVWGPLYFAILHAGIGLALAVNYACIVIGMFVCGRVLFGERFTRDKWLSAGLGIVGLALIFLPAGGAFGWVALSAAALSGLAVAVNGSLSKRLPYGATQSTLTLWLTSMVASAAMAWAFHEPAPVYDWRVEWLYLVLFAVASVGASWCFVKGLKLIEAGAAGVLGLLEIVFGVLFGMAFFHERPGAMELAGVAVVMVAAAIPYLKEIRAR